MFTAFIKRVMGRQYLPLNRVEISSRYLRDNYRELSSISYGMKVIPVLKSNAYGHGLVEVGRIVDELKAPFLCVDSLYEAYSLHKAGIKSKILVMGFVDSRNLNVKKLPFSFAAYDHDHFNAIFEAQPQAGIHIFIDTGMGREGVRVQDLDEFANKINNRAYPRIEGLMSHFAASEKVSDPRTLKQVANFKKALEFFKKKGVRPKWIHFGNSSGIINCRKLGLPEFTNASRAGIALYGIDPQGKMTGLKQVARLITHIVQLKKIDKGDTVGYDFTYKSTSPMIIAVLPIGYSDGIDRDLSGRGRVRINGKFCPILGRVSMNITVVDVTGLKSVRVGNKAEVEFLIQSKHRIPYEFLIHLNPSIKRIVI